MPRVFTRRWRQGIKLVELLLVIAMIAVLIGLLVAGVFLARRRANEDQKPARAESVQSLAFSPDGSRIVTGHAGGMVKVWDAQTGREQLSLQGHND